MDHRRRQCDGFLRALPAAFALAASIPGVAAAAVQQGAQGSPDRGGVEAESPADPSAVDPTTPLDILAYDVVGNTLLDQYTLEKTLYPLLGPGRTLGDVGRAREALETAYRERGFETVVVEIPEQDGSDGTIQFNVIEARVGSLEVKGNRHVSDATIARAVAAFTPGTVPNLPEAQAQLTELNRVADRPVSPILKPGADPGTIDVELEVDDRRAWHASLELTNDHSVNTEPLRLSASLRYADLWRKGHSASFSYFVAPEDRENAEVFSGSYLAPIANSRWSVLLFGYSSTSDVPSAAGTSVLGDGYSIGVRALRQIGATGELSHSVSFGADWKDFDEDITIGDTVLSAPVEYVSLYGGYTLARLGDKATTTATLSVSTGVRVGNSQRFDFDTRRLFASGNFVKVNLEADHSIDIWRDGGMSFRLGAQAADQPVISSEQISFGGLNSVRGYLQSEAVGDSGVFGSVELRSPSEDFLFVDEARFFLFVDGAYAHLLDTPAEQDDDFTLLSVGTGARIRLFGVVDGVALVGLPLTGGTTSPSRDPRFSFSISAEY